MTLFADLDPDDATELAVAITAYIRARKRSLQPVRPATRRMAGLLTTAARRTQPTNVDGCTPAQDSRPMSELRTLEPLAFTVAEVSHLTTLSERKVSELIADGRLPSARIDGRRLVRRADLEAFLEALTTTGTTA